jgi:NADPH-dependent curcumin reductase CurA
VAIQQLIKKANATPIKAHSIKAYIKKNRKREKDRHPSRYNKHTCMQGLLTSESMADEVEELYEKMATTR